MVKKDIFWFEDIIYKITTNNNNVIHFDNNPYLFAFKIKCVIYKKEYLLPHYHQSHTTLGVHMK